MYTLFLICAVVGGTVFVLQVVLAVIGSGADDLDLVDDVPDLSAGDLPDDLPDTSGDVAVDTSTWLFGVISFRSVIAAMTFYGLAGLASLEAQLSAPLALLIAVAAGAGAMYGVHYLMQSLHRLRFDGTVRIQRTMGERGTVYVPIPGGFAGLGKIQIRTQGRIMEYAAKTRAPERLKTGTIVEVVQVLSPVMLEVTPVAEPAVDATKQVDPEGVDHGVV
jgi:membrane protein implicated in regulation of membrane protease activity